MKRWIKITVPVVIVLAAGFFFLFIYQGSSKPIEDVADQFQPDKSWQLVDNRVVPPTFTCLEANCPSVHRSWKIGKNLTKDEFQRLLDDSGWDFAIEGTCVAESRVTGTPGTVCSAHGERNGYQIEVEVVGVYDDPSDSGIVLRVDK